MADLTPLRDAAKEFGVPETTLYRALRQGKLKRWKRELDPKTYIDREELRKLLEFRPVEGDE